MAELMNDESERNIERLLVSFEDSLRRMRIAHPKSMEFRSELRGAVTMLMEESCEARREKMTAQLNAIMERHGLSYSA